MVMMTSVLFLLLFTNPLVFCNLNIVKPENLSRSVRTHLENIYDQPVNITDIPDAYKYRDIVQHAIVITDSRDHHVDRKYEPTDHYQVGNVDNILVSDHNNRNDGHNHNHYSGTHADDIGAYNISSNSTIRKNIHRHSSPFKHNQSYESIRINEKSSRLHHAVKGGGPVIAHRTYKIVSSFSSHSHMYDSSTIHIVYSSDMLMIPFTMLSVASVINRSANASRLCFHFVLIDLKWDARFLNELKLSMGGLSSFESVTWDPMPHVISKMKIRKRERQDLAAPANYARFYISKLFPLVDRFIYLDNDVMAHRSIHELWEINLSNYKLGMVHDCGQWFQDHVVKLKNYNISHPTVMGIFGPEVLNHTCHPNAGIMLVNQQLIKKQGDLSIVEKLIELNKEEFVYKLGSQPLIVLTSWNQYLPLDMVWNIRTTAYKFRHYNKEPGIFHFTGKGRKSMMIRIFLSLLIVDIDEFTALRRNVSSNLSFMDYYNNKTTSLDQSSTMHYNLNNGSIDGFHLSNESIDNSLGDSSIVDFDQEVNSIHTGDEKYNVLTIDHHQLRKDQIEYNKAEQREEAMFEAYWKCVFNDMMRNSSSPIFKYLKHILTKQMVYYQRMIPRSSKIKRKPLVKKEDSNQQRNSTITQSASVIKPFSDTIHHDDIPKGLNDY